MKETIWTREKIEDKFFETLDKVCFVDMREISLGDRISDLDIDSLDMIEFIMACEDVFYIEIPDDDIEDIKIISEFIDYIVDSLDIEKKDKEKKPDYVSKYKWIQKS